MRYDHIDTVCLEAACSTSPFETTAVDGDGDGVLFVVDGPIFSFAAI
jgi:hypothetical protein